ncbi:MAG: hypothetical protein GC204_14335 [Chloroflexi bacterium]|nr:hypothetical protein [Chloroflexota bacterium]
MRKLFALTILMLLFTAVSVFAQDGSLDASTTSSVSLRSGPGTEWRRIATLPTGTNIRLDGRAAGGGWVRGVTQDNQQGWVVDTSLNLSADQLAALPAKAQTDPFTVAAPAGAAPANNPPADQPPADQPPADQAPVTNLAPLAGFEYGGHVAGFGSNTINQMHHAGMTWVKRQVQAFQDYSAPINEAHANGFRILLGVIGSGGSVGDDGYLDQYAQSVAAAAAQGADAIEVWNEPNIDHEWAAGQISPQRYTEMLRRAYNAIKAANPNTLVISAAPAPTGYFGGCSGVGCDDNQFIAGMARAGAANYMDCIGVHYNEGILPPTATSGDPRGSSSYYTRYYTGMVNTYYNAFGGKRKLCFTEFGYLTPEGYPPLPGAFGWAQNVTVSNQASWLAQAISMASRSGKVRLFIIWNIDFTQYDADPQAGYAIIRPGGGCPTCDALAH